MPVPINANRQSCWIMHLNQIVIYALPALWFVLNPWIRDKLLNTNWWTMIAQINTTEDDDNVVMEEAMTHVTINTNLIIGCKIINRIRWVSNEWIRNEDDILMIIHVYWVGLLGWSIISCKCHALLIVWLSMELFGWEFVNWNYSLGVRMVGILCNVTKLTIQMWLTDAFIMPYLYRHWFFHAFSTHNKMELALLASLPCVGLSHTVICLWSCVW
jgi:hypothetical protein